jgi:uncharacterized protein VirK/YbjX
MNEIAGFEDGAEPSARAGLRTAVTGMLAVVGNNARAALRLFRNLSGEIEILRLIMMKYPVFAGVLPSSPRFPLKFVSPGYLARGLSVAERKDCFLHHYNRLGEALPNTLLRRILHDRVSIFEVREGESVYRVTAHLSRARHGDTEGELCLGLELNGEAIYILSFSIVPGRIVNSEAREVLLLARIQGTKGKYGSIRQATKAMKDIAPASLLMASLQGFAEAFDVSEIAGVSATRQSIYTEDLAERFREAYDDFFTNLGAVASPEGFYRCPVPLPEKPLTEVKRGHKLRTREKRAIKRIIADAVCRYFRQCWRRSDDAAREDSSSLEQAVELPIQLEFQDAGLKELRTQSAGEDAGRPDAGSPDAGSPDAGSPFEGELWSSPARPRKTG